MSKKLFISVLFGIFLLSFGKSVYAYDDMYVQSLTMGSDGIYTNNNFNSVNNSNQNISRSYTGAITSESTPNVVINNKNYYSGYPYYSPGYIQTYRIGPYSTNYYPPLYSTGFSATANTRHSSFAYNYGVTAGSPIYVNRPAYIPPAQPATQVPHPVVQPAINNNSNKNKPFSYSF